MPQTRNNYTYEAFVAGEDEQQRARLIGEFETERASAARQRETLRRAGSPFRSGSPDALNGLRWLSDAERALSQNITFDDSTYMTRRTGYADGFADYLRNRKGVYQFIKDAPPRYDKAGAIRNYTAMRALRLPSAGISRAARQYGAGDLSRQACQTVRVFRQEYREAMAVQPSGYTVVRWFDGRKIEYRLSVAPLPTLPDGTRAPTRVELWAKVREHFKTAIRRAREERRLASVDPLAGKMPNFHLQKNAMKMLRAYKKPDENVRSVGIEIECFMPRTADMTKFWPVAQYVNVGSDGSIHPEGRDMVGVEFRVCAPAYKMAEVVTLLCAALKEVGAKVNTSCGLHVHLDQRNRSMEEIGQTFSNFIRAQNLLFEVVPKSRRNNTYCKKHRGTDFDQATRGQRYKAINASAFRKHKTIEIRLFSGTVNAEKIINWVKTLWAIEAGQPVLRCPKTFDIAQRYWRIDPVTLQWLKARQEKFKDVPRDNTDVMDAEPIEEGN